MNTFNELMYQIDGEETFESSLYNSLFTDNYYIEKEDNTKRKLTLMQYLKRLEKKNKQLKTIIISAIALCGAMIAAFIIIKKKRKKKNEKGMNQNTKDKALQAEIAEPGQRKNNLNDSYTDPHDTEPRATLNESWITKSISALKNNEKPLKENISKIKETQKKIETLKTNLEECENIEDKSIRQTKKKELNQQTIRIANELSSIQERTLRLVESMLGLSMYIKNETGDTHYYDQLKRVAIQCEKDHILTVSAKDISLSAWGLESQPMWNSLIKKYEK